MIDARDFLEAVARHDAGVFTGVPCSLLRPLINQVMLNSDMQYVSAVSEGEAVGIAVGSTLAGRIGVVLLQNSGLGNTVNPITSLTNTYRIPCLLIVSHRGDPGGEPDAVQHHLMGSVTADLLDLLDLPWGVFPSEPDHIDPAVRHAFASMEADSLPAALLLKRGSLAAFDPVLPVNDAERRPGETFHTDGSPGARPSRQEAIAEIGRLLHEEDLVVSATGKISRELFCCCDRPGNFYMQGSMGTTAAIGLGVALCRPERSIVVLDGDGGVLMRMGSLATVGYSQPARYLHIVLDNGSYDSTGGQPSAAPAVSFSRAAVAAGYRRAATVTSLRPLRDFWNEFRGEQGPSLLHIKVSRGASPDLPRPSWTPKEIRDRFSDSMSSYSK